jgi:Peptidase family M23
LIEDLIDEIDDGGGGGGDDELVLSVTPVDITGPFDAVTQTYGDVRFEDPVLVPFGADLGGGDLSPAFEYITTPDAPVRAATEGIVAAIDFDAVAMDFEIRIAQGDRWLVIYDHVLNVVVSVGNVVDAGDQLGTSGTWSATAGRTELQVNDQDAGVARCPLEFGTTEFVDLHEALRVAVDASAFGPLPSLCLVLSVVP